MSNNIYIIDYSFCSQYKNTCDLDPRFVQILRPPLTVHLKLSCIVSMILIVIISTQLRFPQ